MSDWVSEMSLKDPKELLLLEDGWADFLNLPEVSLKNPLELKRFQDWVIFNALIDNTENYGQVDQDKEEGYIFDILSGKTKEELLEIYRLLDKAAKSPFEDGLSDKEVIERTRSVILLSLFDFFLQERNLNNTPLILSFAGFLKRYNPFGIKIDGQGCFFIVFNNQTVEKNSQFSTTKNNNRKNQNRSPNRLFWHQKEDNGSYLIYTPPDSLLTNKSPNQIGNLCLEIEINKLCLQEQKTTRSYQGKDPAQVSRQIGQQNRFGSLTFTNYYLPEGQRKISLSLVETAGKPSRLKTEMKKIITLGTNH